MRNRVKFRLLAYVLFYLCGYHLLTKPVQIVLADPGDLNTSFGADHDGDGVLDGYSVYDKFRAADLVYQADGNIFIVGYAGCGGDVGSGYIARVTSTGALDTTFGTASTGYVQYDYDLDGIGSSPTVGELAQIAAVTNDAAGNLFVTGLALSDASSDTRLFVTKYDANGEADATLHTSGIYDVASSKDKGNDLALDQNGNLVVVGQTHSTTSDDDSLLVIFESNGTQRASGSFIRSQTGPDVFNAVALDYNDDATDYSIVAVGNLENADGNKDISIVRLTSLGAYDSYFDDDGYLSKDYLDDDSGGDSAQDVIIDVNGNIFVTGYVTDADGDRDAFVAKYTSVGTPDPEFGTDGYAYFDSGLGDDAAYAIAIDSIGSVLIGGEMSYADASKGFFFLARFTALGELDTGFGQANDVFKAGYVSLDVDPDVLYSQRQTFAAIALDENENMIVTGNLTNFIWGSANQAILAKFDGGYLDAVCGDGATYDSEACEDGNVVDGDGCSATCAIEEDADGDGYFGASDCDDTDATVNAGCDDSVCGDKSITGAEECDDGNFTTGDGCDASCKSEGTAVDADADGVDATLDCDDNDPSIQTGCPDAAESALQPGGCGCVINAKQTNGVEFSVYAFFAMLLMVARWRKGCVASKGKTL